MNVVNIPLNDFLALAYTLLCWQGVGWWIESGPRAHLSMAAIMNGHRLDWARRIMARDQRILDSALLTSLQNGAAFFSSICMFAIGGAAALLGGAESLARTSADLPFAAPASPALWRFRLAVLLALLIFAFFKFAWAHRLFAYNAILIGAMAPFDAPGEGASREDLAVKAAALNTRAAASFNRGLRALYFALGGLGWLLGPWGAMAGACLVVWALWRREFISLSRAALSAKGE